MHSLFTGSCQCYRMGRSLQTQLINKQIQKNLQISFKLNNTFALNFLNLWFISTHFLKISCYLSNGIKFEFLIGQRHLLEGKNSNHLQKSIFKT